MKQTKYWTVKEIDREGQQAINQAANLLKQQEVIAFPTETVYGLGADATSSQAVSNIFAAKGRPSDNPLIVHLASSEQIGQYVTTITPIAKKLIDAFMPGPLTIILASNGKIAANVTAGLDTIGIRIPDHPIARALLKEANLPIAAPSANTSGKPSPTSAVHVYNDLNGKIAGIIDGGPTGVGLESTVVDCTTEVPVVLRPGGVTQEQLEEVTGTLVLDHSIKKEDQPKAPGMKYNHYEPEVPLYLVDGDAAFIQSQIDRFEIEGKKVGVMVSEELVAHVTASNMKIIGSQADLTTVAVHLYDTLRAFNKTDVDIILAEVYPKIGLGEAIMNRLEKAASQLILQ
ncbi:L-threonylcarbamoyladenylate synthase [Paraliobacillus sediminis]|uniref:L-threonylcarbamoyladenylate synthase n=1 Tax=Paraliobacillus sediminis TaxID=1885916 RepID=UPI000E3D68A5|nr:L-threonylcarbamoyladenylate synthase [Paraliobacillus sediminis]